jgi:hypothetical protein
VNQRDLLRANLPICAGQALSRAIPGLADTPLAGQWRTFEVITKIELLKPNAVSHMCMRLRMDRDKKQQELPKSEDTL